MESVHEGCGGARDQRNIERRMARWHAA